jgi:hypothetical protein
MSYAKEFNFVPISDSTPEYHFGNSGPVNMWIEFQKSDYSIWRGSFECGESRCREIIEQENNEFIIIANGIGYRIDNDTNSLKSKVDLDNIIFGTKINNKECLIANWMGLYILDSENNLTEIENLNSLDWIKIEEQNDEKIIGKFDSSSYQWETKYFEFNKLTKKVNIRNTAYNNGYNSLWQRAKTKFNL